MPVEKDGLALMSAGIRTIRTKSERTPEYGRKPIVWQGIARLEQNVYILAFGCFIAYAASIT
ncbi:hypothetical protein C0075_11585 [Rhizobium sp. KAs_5_22]|nr:hypothetical protein C0075_11585 [Rhizobium sp. KAs_5_22]